MIKRLVIVLVLSMVALGILFGLVLYWVIMSVSENFLMHCIIMGAAFGLVNSVIALIFLKIYSNVKTKNQMLDMEIRIDKLTGLYNRRAFDNDIHRFNAKTIYSMIFLDIDNFRDFNNIHGHQIGDKILGVFASIIKSSIRHTDFAYRYGGDEIVVLLPDCGKKEAGKIAQNIIERIHSYDNAPYPSIAASAGIASMPEDAQSFDQLIKVSDFAMVKAKNIGKNQVFIYGEDLEQTNK